LLELAYIGSIGKEINRSGVDLLSVI
jgi:hypothetical protein